MNRLPHLLFISCSLFCAAAPCRAQFSYSFNSGMNCYGDWRLPDTSTKPYSAVSGDDASYQPAISSPSFAVNGNGTTIDNVTGLMWVSSSSATMYNWQTALSSCAGITAGSLNFGSGYAGYTDWRLPNVRELMSIVDYGLYAPAINSVAFPATRVATPYWTSTTYRPSVNNAVVVNFNTGGVMSLMKTASGYVKCVRGGP